MTISTSKKRIFISTIVLIIISLILWAYPSFLQKSEHVRFTVIVFGASFIFLYFKFQFNEIVKGILSLVLLLGMAYVLFCNLQHPLVQISDLNPGAVFLNVGLIFIGEMILFLIINRTRVVGIIIAIFMIFLAVSNMFIYYFRGRPIAPTDIHSLKIAIGVSSNYTLWMNDYVMKDILYLFVFIIIFLQLDFRIKKNKNRMLVIIISSALIIASFLTIYSNAQLKKKDFVLHQVVPLDGMKANGYLLDFYMNSKGLTVMKPSGYNLESLNALNKEIIQTMLPTESSKLPNILIIMNESFSDLEALEDITYSKDPLSFFNSLEENTIRGNLMSSVYGGNTPNSEFECMTGGSLAFFPKDSIVYQQFLHSAIPSSISELSDLGYETIAMHPYNKIYWERNRIYPDVLGFDEFISQDTFDNPLLVRDFISDEAVFDLLLERLRTDEEGDRIYNFTITMQNHGGYFYGMNDITAPEINDPYVDEYLSLMNVTDKAFQEFIEELESFEEPTIVCMFGDHQPRLGDTVYDTIWKNSEFTEEEKEIRKHIVPFVIWANYDIEEEEIPLTSINYLSPMIFQVAKIQSLPYYSYLLSLQEEYPSISSMGCFDNDNNFYSIGEEMNEILEIQEYERIQYNYIHDEKNRNEEFFGLIGK